MRYLVNAYAKESTLVPKTPKEAAIVDQRLYFDAGTLFPRLVDYFVSLFLSLMNVFCQTYLSNKSNLFQMPVMFFNAKPESEKEAKVHEALQWLDMFLQNQVWTAGQYMTIADFALVTTISTAEVCIVQN